MNFLEIIFGDSCYLSMQNSKLNKNVLKFGIPFNIADLSKIDHNIVIIPEGLYNPDFGQTSECSIEEEVTYVRQSIKKGERIRIWTSHYDIYSYLMMVFLCYVAKEYDCELYVVYSEEYGKEILSPSYLNSEELESLAHFTHLLSKEEILQYALEWENLVKKNSEMRVLEDSKIKFVSFNYYDDIILEKLKRLGQVKEARLVGTLMGDIYLHDILFAFLIERLIQNGKIEIVEKK